MRDLISRQAAIDAFKKELTVGESKGNYVTLCSAVTYEGAKQILESLPSAQPNKEQKKTGEWEMFELITSVYYGKQYYFEQENGIVYSRASGKYMSVDDAINEFLDVIGE